MKTNTDTGQRPSGSATQEPGREPVARQPQALRQALQAEINAMSARLVGLPWEEVDNGVHEALGRLGSFAQAHRAYIFLSRDGNMMDNTHEWCAEGIAPQIDRLKDQNMDDFSWWMARLRRGETIHIPRVADLPAEARAERDVLEMQEIASLIVVPLISGNALIGFLGFDAVREPRVWPDHVPVLLRVAADIIAAVLHRQRLDRLLVDNSTLAMAVHEMIFDTDGNPIDYRFLLANAAFEQATGLRAPDIVGRLVSDVIPGIGETPFIALYGDVVQTGQPTTTEQYSPPLQRHYTIHAYALGENRFATAFHDVSEQKREETMRARLQAQLNQAQQIARIGSWEYDHQEDRLLWSDETYRIFGMDPLTFSESYEGFLSTVHPDDVDRVKAEYARSLADPDYPYGLDHRIVRRDTGEVRIVHEKCTHERDADGHAVRSYGLVQDITDAVKRNTLLRQSQKLEAMGLLSAGIAHEINNPVSFLMNNFAALETDVICFRDLLVEYRALRCKAEDIPGLADVAARLAGQREANIDFVLDDLDSLLSESKAGLERIADIVTGMRRFARDDRTDHRESWDVNSGIRTILSIARNEYKYHCDVTTDLARDLPPIQCVPGKICQVLLNLLMNAVHAIEAEQSKDKGHIHIRTFKESDNVCIEVGDDGPGIAPSIRETIFEPFVTTKPLGKGTGLGLPISRDIVVNLHGGSLTVASDDGRGAVFRVCLPGGA